ncbi:MAG: lytic transglycosylase domain-containing protein [Rhodoferax sp.]|uniref:lytic transglycosylase domain-containing protein n=1 Tax=Rhodoferax sp. TaxID=50421 RepID=UPI001B640B61|nr:lytic transglycosylase domain-containing protein [Rhodoferax sp.]MBP9904967.1 lytic transglycosylase domain-containing protein [Rhodoferax sp.]
MSATYTLISSLRRVTAAVTKGFFEVTHNSFALIGLLVLFAAMTLVAQPELRQMGEAKLYNWLHERQFAETGLVTDLIASERATAANPNELPKPQAAVALWLSKKYRVAPEPLSALVSEAYEVGEMSKLDPTLILAVMAIESRFNPFAQSPVGAQGLMQVMTKIHSAKYESFGGTFAAFDPLANLRVGVKVLKDCIAITGSLEGGLRYYVGASSSDTEGGYAGKVMAEYAKLQLVAAGRQVPFNSPATPATAPNANDADPVPDAGSEPARAATVALK